MHAFIRFSFILAVLAITLTTAKHTSAACSLSCTADLPGWGQNVTLTDCVKTIATTVGVDWAENEASTVNTASLTLAGTSSITINSGGQLTLGALHQGSNTVSIAQGGVIKLNTPLYIDDADGDGWASAALTNATLYTATGSGRRRLSFMRGWTTDCADSLFSTSNLCAMTASGGTISYSGNYKYHTFTGSGTFTVSQLGANNTVDYLVVAGGGGGGGALHNFGGGGGGGGGGMLEGSITAGAASYSVVVGGGGAGGPGNPCTRGNNGANSSFYTITATGGGGGGNCGNGGSAYDGGSGGGAGGALQYNLVGTGIVGQGYNGGPGQTAWPSYSGGGGGAGSPGVLYGAGAGRTSTINGGYYAAGGHAGRHASWSKGGGYAPGAHGTANTGNGGGGATAYTDDSDPDNKYYYDANGGNGGSGIVVLRYLYQ